MPKHFVKFIFGGIGIALAAIVILFGVKYFEYRTSQDYKAAQYFDDLKQKYAEDTYGGNTPEETLKLFIDALKKGDTDLAAKYFILDKQNSWSKYLAKIKDKGLLEKMVIDLERLKKTKNENTEAFFTLTNKENIVSIQLIIAKSTDHKKWKIYEL